MSEIRATQTALEASGWQVFIPQELAAAEVQALAAQYAELSPEEQRQLRLRFIDAHLQKIRVAEAILVVNGAKKSMPGYIGANTLVEMAFAYVLGKKIYVLHPIGPQPNQDEATALAEVVLHGDLQRLPS